MDMLIKNAESNTKITSVVLCTKMCCSKKYQKRERKTIFSKEKQFLSALELTWKAAFKKSKAKLGLLTHIDMLLMVKKGIIGKICHAIHQYATA